MLAGCASPPAVMQGYQAKPSEIGLKIVDVRPQEDRLTENLSLLITACDYGVTRHGDEVTVPSRLALLERDLESALGKQLSNSEVQIAQYRIFTNQASKYRAMAGEGAMSQIAGAGSILASALAGGIAGGSVAALQFAGSKCAKEEMRGGWYAGSELTAQRSPIIIEIKAGWKGKTYEARKVYTPQHEIIAWFGDQKNASELFEAMHQAHTTLADKMR